MREPVSWSTWTRRTGACPGAKPRFRSNQEHPMPDCMGSPWRVGTMVAQTFAVRRSIEATKIAIPAHQVEKIQRGNREVVGGNLRKRRGFCEIDRSGQQCMSSPMGSAFAWSIAMVLRSRFLVIGAAGVMRLPRRTGCDTFIRRHFFRSVAAAKRIGDENGQQGSCQLAKHRTAKPYRHANPPSMTVTVGGLGDCSGDIWNGACD